MSTSEDGEKKERNVPSPCISVCALNEDDVCTGCYRNVQEIREWRDLTNPQRREVINRALEREKRVNPFL